MPKLTLLMIITPPDFGIARYSLAALRKHIRHLPDCSLSIYQNGLSEQQERAIATIIRGTDWHSTSNRSRLLNSTLKMGEWYKTDQGTAALRMGL